MGQSSNKGIPQNNEKKRKEELKKGLNGSYKKKWEIEEKQNIIGEFEKLNIKGKQRMNSQENALPEVKIEKISIDDITLNESEDYDQEINCIFDEKELDEFLKNKFNEIKRKADTFLDGYMDNLYQEFIYVTEVNKYLDAEINLIKIKSPKDLIKPGEAVFSKDYIIKFLGYLGGELSLYDIKVFIEKEPSNEIIRDITFKIILSGLAFQRIYKIIIQSEEDKNNFQENIQNWYNFNYKIKNKISEDMKIDIKEIYFFNYDTTNFEVTMIIYNQRLDGVEDILKTFNVEVLTNNLLNNIILSSNMFLTKFCKNKDEWKTAYSYRGGSKYFPPYGWDGFALKLRNKFGNNFEWLGNKGKKGKEWCVAFHGIGKGDEFKKLLSILNDNLRVGPKQRYSRFVNKKGNFRSGKIICGKGVYLTPDIKRAENYANKIKLGHFRKNIQFILMARVDPYKIRDPGVVPVNWILNGGDDEVRPYRLLVKIS